MRPGGLSNVIEDGFFRAKQGTEKLKLNVIHTNNEYPPKQRVPEYQTVFHTSRPRVPEYQVLSRTSKPWVPKYQTVSQTSKPRVTKFQTVSRTSKPKVPKYQIVNRTNKPRRPEYQEVNRPKYQIIPGYSKVMDARIRIEDVSAPKIFGVGGTRSEVSVASSLGMVKGPEYPHRPKLAPATLQAIVRHTQPPKKYESQNKRNSIFKKSSSNQKEELRNQKKPLSKPVIQSRVKQYDPFEFQLTQRPETKKQSVFNKIISNNRLDSRLSIQVKTPLSSYLL